MIIIGIDIGSKNFALSVIEAEKKFVLLDQNYICLTDKKLGNRLDTIYNLITSKIEEFKPNLLVFEDSVFKGRNAKALNYVCGLVHLASGKYNLDIKSPTPTEIKKKIAGSGKADKLEVDLAVKLKLENPPEKFDNDHLSDSVAIALTPII